MGVAALTMRWRPVVAEGAAGAAGAASAQDHIHRDGLFGRYRRVHLVGVGGAGMEGLARLLAQQGCRVSGTDQSPSRVLEELSRAGVQVHVGHDAAVLAGAELVIYSAAVPPDNAELVEAARLGVPTVGRAELLGELVEPYYTVAVAGTHGKTTTASMLAAILRRTDLAPSVLIGGWVGGQPQAQLGAGEVFVVEADEYARSFLSLRPKVAVVTNIEDDHLECYGDDGALRAAFADFLGRVPFYGGAILNGDDPGTETVRGACRGWEVLYGEGDGEGYRASEIELKGQGARFDLKTGRRELARIELAVPGRHNVSNALAAAAAALELGADAETVAAGLAGFRGVDRRFQVRGLLPHDVLLVDDYAHHPAEVRAALAAARGMGRRVVAAFQPHLYSRTARFYGQFAEALAGADRVLLAPVYGSREAPVAGVDSGLIATALRRAGHGRVEVVADLEEMTSRLQSSTGPGDLVLILGAGDIHRVADALAGTLEGEA